MQLTLVNTAVGTGMLLLSGAIAAIGYAFGIMTLVFVALSLSIGLHCYRVLILSYKGTSVYSTLVEYVISKVLRDKH